MFLPNGPRSAHKPDSEADCQQHERGDDGQTHVQFHDSLDNKISERVLVTGGFRIGGPKPPAAQLRGTTFAEGSARRLRPPRTSSEEAGHGEADRRGVGPALTAATAITLAITFGVRPVGPEPSVGATIASCLRGFLDSGSNRVATGSTSVPRFRQPPAPIDYTADGAKMAGL